VHQTLSPQVIGKKTSSNNQPPTALHDIFR
jgi:hypothetical protein